ncbi:tetratricopeptide repeat protein [Streptomyces tricolor]|nr:tetratricopeptide repeat protein [Streptomyces tricolor]
MASLLEQLIQLHGREHYRTLAFLTNYGNYLREHGDLSQARRLIDEAEAGYRSLLGPAHPVATGMLSNTGLVMQAAGSGARPCRCSSPRSPDSARPSARTTPGSWAAPSTRPARATSTAASRTRRN